MKTIDRNALQIAAVFIWIGFVCAISFMEAWLKFTAPGISIPLGLGIGRIVFHALSMVEWTLFISILLCRLFSKPPHVIITTRLLLSLFMLLGIQRIWLLPALDIRAEALINGQAITASYLHLYYVLLEIAKLVLLGWLGLRYITARQPAVDKHPELTN